MATEERAVAEQADTILVTKPQFDVNKMEPGTAVYFETRTYNGYIGERANALVVKCAPLTLEILYMGKENKYESKLTRMTKTITIEQVVDKTIKLKIIKGAVN